MESRFQLFYGYLSRGFGLHQISKELDIEEYIVVSEFMTNYYNLSHGEQDFLFGVGDYIEKIIVTKYKELNLSPVLEDVGGYFKEYRLCHYQISHIGYKYAFLYHPSTREYADFELERRKYEYFFMCNRDFALTYLSLYFPFDYNYLIDNWNRLVPGKAFYSYYFDDWVQHSELHSSSGVSYISISGINYRYYQSEIGLCFNKNIRWNSYLRAKYEYGILKRINGKDELFGLYGEQNSQEIESNHRQISIDERCYSDGIIPLEISLDIINSRSILDVFRETWLHCEEHGFPEHFVTSFDFKIECLEKDIDLPDKSDILMMLNSVHPRLEFTEFMRIFEEEPLTVLANGSIYENTIKHYLEFNFVDKIVRDLFENADFF
jgi:hypothetical protein